MDRHESGYVLTVDEVASRLEISRSSAYEAVRRGEIPSLRIGRRIVIPVSMFLAWLRGAEAAPSAQPNQTPD